MTPNCRQPLTNGQACAAPAIHGSKFCRHHHPQRPPRHFEEDHKQSLLLPPLIDKSSILVAINEVVQALAEGRIKRSVAETLLSGIKLAVRLITEIDQEIPAGLLDELATGQAIDDPTSPAFASDPTGRPDSYVRNGAIALAASAHGPESEGVFAASHAPLEHPSSAYPSAPDASPLDPSSLGPSPIDSFTARLVQNLVAQSHQLAKSQALHAE